MTSDRDIATTKARRWSAKIAVRWATWLAVLLVATWGMFLARTALDKAHIALVFLLIVLGASAAGGRILGLTVASLAFLAFDVLFLPPYGRLTVTNSLDWLVLVAFLATSVVATQLLYRANATAAAATERAREVDRLASLGAETLNAVDAYEALRAIAGVIRNSIDVDECDIYLRRSDGGVHPVAHARRHDSLDANGQGRSAGPEVPSDAGRKDSLVGWILQHGTGAAELEDGTIRLPQLAPPPAEPNDLHPHGQHDTTAVLRMVLCDGDARMRRALPRVDAAPTDGSRVPMVRALALPLRVREHIVGVLRIASADGLLLTAEQARLLTALSYYAALGAERARLVATAERAEAERRLEALRSALLTAVSHDLRTPLTTIKGIANEIARGNDASRATIIEAEADRLDALVGALLDLSRIYAGAVRPVPAVNTVDDLLGAALRGATGAVRGRKVEIDLPPGVLLVGLFDFSQTLRILINLIDNAAKYSPPASPIEIRGRQAGSHLIIDVMDHGPGIPEAERDRIFEPFYRPPGVPPDIRGHGLGLSIARGLAEAQGGTLRYAARQDGGSIFSLELNAADASGSESPATVLL
ncbi:MAG: ATP-binding protein [Gemmatimonadaceae bacterium]